jgi:hypothetical protein
MGRKYSRAPLLPFKGPRRFEHRLGARLPLFFVALVVLAAIIGIWVNSKFEKEETAFQSSHTHQPNKPSQGQTKAEGLTGKLTR